VTRDLPLTTVEIETPLVRTTQRTIAGKKLVFAPVLRAGMTFVEGMLDLVPTARVAHIGMYREPETFVAVEYFFKAPADLGERRVIVVAPVIATANTAVAAVDRLKERGARDIRLVCLLGAPEGFERLRGIHPDVDIWTAAIDESLDENAYILPGLGDAGAQPLRFCEHALDHLARLAPVAVHARAYELLSGARSRTVGGNDVGDQRGKLVDDLHD
jgi:uracil phosphoribosyltransferase